MLRVEFIGEYGCFAVSDPDPILPDGCKRGFYGFFVDKEAFQTFASDVLNLWEELEE